MKGTLVLIATWKHAIKIVISKVLVIMENVNVIMTILENTAKKKDVKMIVMDKVYALKYVNSFFYNTFKLILN